MNEHKLTLLGGDARRLSLPASLLYEAVGALIEGARLATRFAVEGESLRKGPRPSWLDAACDFNVTSLSAGSAVIAMEAPTLSEVDPTRFGGEQAPFLSEASGVGTQTAIDIFGHLLTTILEAKREVQADRALLDSCARFARVSGGAYDGLALQGLQNHPAPLEITSIDAERIESLRDETPRPQAVRVTGRLDTVSASRADVVLALKDGTRVPGWMEEHELDALRGLLGEEVTVSGVAQFAPSGRLLRVRVEALDAARPEDQLFTQAPRPRPQQVDIEENLSKEPSGVGAFFGIWPGDETDAELLEALRGIE